MQSRHAYPSDVSDEAWALVAPYLTLLPETAAQREHTLREMCDGLRSVRRLGRTSAHPGLCPDYISSPDRAAARSEDCIRSSLTAQVVTAIGRITGRIREIVRNVAQGSVGQAR